jgi:hypothetical protein
MVCQVNSSEFFSKLIAVNNGQPGIINVRLKVRITRMNHNYLLYMLHIAMRGNLKSKGIAFIVLRKLSHKSRKESIKNLLQHGKKPFRKMES